MTPLDVLLARLLFAAAGSLAAGLAVWAAAVLCARRFPALAGQRSLWLLGQLAVAIIFGAILLPHTDRLRMVPVIDMNNDPLPFTAGQPSQPAIVTATDAAPATAAEQRGAKVAYAARAWCLLYFLGLGYFAYRQWRARQLLQALIATGTPLTASDDHPGFMGKAQALLPHAIEVCAPISPMLQGIFKPRLLLPRHLRNFDRLQQQLIIEHELTHWRRRDLQLSAASVLLQGVFWFNPFMRMLHDRLGWSQEFGCDHDVLSGRPPEERKAYAAALVMQLGLQQQPFDAALAFGASGQPSLVSRVKLIRSPMATRSRWPRYAALASLAVVVCANLMLQPALNLHAANLGALDCTIMADASSGKELVREGSCDERVTPASTFKIAISLMGFDSGVLRDDHSPYLPYEERYASPNPSWRHGTDPASWLRESVVWYSQQVVSRVGAAGVRGYVQAFDYGNRELASVAGVDDAIALSEVSPTLRISPSEQAIFLRKVVNRQLPLSAHAYELTERLLKVNTPVNGWQVYGKTGTASIQRPDGTADQTQDIGWFVGWVVKDGRRLVFARLLQHSVLSYHHAGSQTREAFMSELARRAL